MKDVFSKGHGDGSTGYTEVEAHGKITAVNEAYRVGSPTSRWQPAKAVPDPRGGYMVEIETI